MPLLPILSVSRPDKVFFPPANWKLTKNYNVEVDVGPAVEHIYEVIDVSCACSVGLSRLVWKADIIVKKKRRRRKTEEENQITRWDLRQCRSMDLWIKKSTPDINISTWERNCLEKQMKNLRGLLQFF